MSKEYNNGYNKGYNDGYIKRESEISKSNFFREIHDLINADIYSIYESQGGQMGMYSAHTLQETDGLHRGDGIMERIIKTKVRGYEKYVVRIYVLNCNCGGICILGYLSENNELYYTLFHLGEDDGWFFIHEDSKAGLNHMNKLNFMDMLSRSMSLLNNIK